MTRSTNVFADLVVSNSSGPQIFALMEKTSRSHLASTSERVDDWQLEFRHFYIRRSYCESLTDSKAISDFEIHFMLFKAIAPLFRLCYSLRILPVGKFLS